MDRTAMIIGSRPPVMAMLDAAMRLVGKLTGSRVMRIALLVLTLSVAEHAAGTLSVW